jgi:phage shock protein PspC (stress-responsive transcriptional regulator)
MTATETRFTPPEDPHRPRRYTRSTSNRMIAGVCGGFAEYTGIDVNIIRLATVALALFGGGGLLLYIVAWALVPEG